jgi:uncharacterized protein with PIN domain
VIAVDTSALVAIFLDEAEGELYSDLIRAADEPCVSTATVAETLTRIPQMDWRSASPVHQFPLVRQDFTLDQAAEP